MRMRRDLLCSAMAGLMVAGGVTPAAAAAGDAEVSAIEDFAYPNDAAVPDITLVRGDGRIELVECVDGGTGLLRVRSSLTTSEFCFDIKGPGGYLSLSLQKTYQLRGDGSNHVEAAVSVNGAAEPTDYTVPDTSWLTVPVQSGGVGNTLVELRSLDERATGTTGTPAGDLPFVARVHVGDSADGGRACSGALVNEWWVVTAKQCFAEAGQAVVAGRPARPTKVTLGRPDVSGSAAGVSVSVARVVPHPDRDVVLAQLASAVTTVTPVRLASAAPAVGTQLRVAGFGRTSEAWVPEAPHAGTFAVTGVTADRLAVAPAAETQVGPCRGDAGGPGLLSDATGPLLVALTLTAGQQGCRGGTTGTGSTASQIRLDGLAGWFAAQFGADTVNVVTNDNSDLCLAVSGGSTTNGEHVIQWGCGGGAEQDWRLQEVVAGAYQVRNDNSGQCLAVGNGSTADGAHVLQWPCGGVTSDEQQWQLVAGADGDQQLRNVNSGECLAIGSATKEPGDHAIQWPCRTETNREQFWQITGRIAGVRVTNTNSSLCASNGGVQEQGAPLVLAACNTSNDAEWHLRTVVGGYAQLRNDRTGLCAAIAGASTTDGAPAIQWPCNDKNVEHRWYVDLDAAGKTSLINANSGECLAVLNAAKTAGSKLVQMPCKSGSADQVWTF